MSADFLLFLSSLLLFGLSMCYTPGPNNALCMSIGLDKGFRAALPYCLGATIGANVSLVLLGFGLGEVFDRAPLVYDLLRYCGALYMLWLAWKISGLPLPGLGRQKSTLGQQEAGSPDLPGAEQPFLAANGQNAAQSPGPGKQPRGKATLGFVPGLLLQTVNVKVWITNVVVVSSYVGTGPDARFRFWFSVVLLTFLGGSAMCLWAAGGAFMRRFLTSDGMRRANYLFAAFLVLSVMLLFVNK